MSRIRDVLEHRNNMFVGANGNRPPIIQIHFPICGTMAFLLRITVVFARYLNGWMICWVHGKWNKKIGNG